MSYVDGRFANPLSKRRALILLAVLALGSFLHGMFRDVEFRWPWGAPPAAAPQPVAPPAPTPAPAAQVLEAPPEAPTEKDDDEPETPEPKADAAGPAPEPVAIEPAPPPPAVQPAPLVLPPAAPAQAPATAEDPPI
jgi:hypothetical protein